MGPLRGGQIDKNITIRISTLRMRYVAIAGRPDDSHSGCSQQPPEMRGHSSSESAVTQGEGPAGAGRPPESLRPSHFLLQPYPADVARQLFGGSWLSP